MSAEKTNQADVPPSIATTAAQLPLQAFSSAQSAFERAAVEFENDYEHASNAALLVKQAMLLKAGRFRPETAISMLSELQDGNAYIGRVGMDNGALRSLFSQFVHYIERLAAEREQEKKRALDAETAGQKSRVGSVLENTETMQPWVDTKREAAFATFLQQLESTMEDDGVQAVHRWFLQIINLFIADQKGVLLTEKDIRSLVVSNVHATLASEVTGMPIRRPVFLFQKVSDYQKVSVTLQGPGGMGSRGMNIGGEHFRDPILKQTGLLISTTASDIVSHEIRHSVDPLLHKREGYNGIIEEAFTYYPDRVMVDAGLDGSVTDNGPWVRFGIAIGQDTYYQKYCTTPPRLTPAEFQTVCNELAAALRQYQATFQNARDGHIAILRLLCQCKTLAEVFQRTGTIRPALLNKM